MSRGEARPEGRAFAPARRRRQVEAQLQRAGFASSAVLEPPPWPDPEHDLRVRRLRTELAGLGPVFARLGRYLSTRVEHLPAEDCRALAALPDRAEPMPEPEVSERLRAEFGGSGLASLAQLEAEPVESRLMSQTHHGRLADGRAVAVRLARSGLLADPDRVLLPRLAARLSNVGWPFAAVARILEDFDDLVVRELDLRRAAAALDQLSESTAEGRLFAAPRVVPALSSSRFLTLELPAETSLFPGPPPGADPDAETRARTRALADLWMHLVFTRFRIPEELSPADVRLAPGGGVELIGGLFQPLASDDAAALWRYFEAAARDDTESVFAALQALSTPREQARPEALRHQLHHVVPRRDGRFGPVPPGLPELLLSHWRELERHGLTPNPALLAAYRGLVCLREVAGGGLSHDVLREALQVAQISRGAEELRKAVSPAQVVRSALSMIDMLADLPRRLERAGAQKLAEAEPATRATDGDEPKRANAGWAALAAGLLLVGSLVIWFERLPALFGGWTPALQAGALALVGLGLIRIIWRS